MGLGGPQGRSGQVRKISFPPGFDPRIVQPVASRYTDWAMPDHIVSAYFTLMFDNVVYCYVITVFRRGTNDTFCLTGLYTAQNGSSLTSFRHNPPVPYSRVGKKLPWFQTFAVIWMLYAFSWVISRRLNVIMPTFPNSLSVPYSNELWIMNRLEKFLQSSPLHTCLPMKMEQSVPKRRHIKFRRQGIAQEKAYKKLPFCTAWNLKEWE